MKITIREIVLITFVSIAIAFAYNLSRPSPLPLIWEPKEVKTLSDDDLFGTKDIPNPANDENDLTDDIIKEPDALKPDDKEVNSSKTNELVESKNGALADATDLANPNDHSKGSEFTVTYEQMKRIVNNPDFIIIDARSPEMYAKSRIGKAINIFPYADESEFMPKILDIPTNKRIVVYCDGGNCDSSHKLADAIKTFGYENVFIYTGGWDDWIKHQGIN